MFLLPLASETPTAPLANCWFTGSQGANSRLHLVCGRVRGSLGYSNPCPRKNPKSSHL